MKDLFEQWEQQPIKLRLIIDKYAKEDLTYQTCEQFLNEVNSIGYTFEYDLSAQPYNLTKIQPTR